MSRPIAIAARVSSERQKEEQTIQSQIAEIEGWARENDCLIIERYIDDGWSGDILARPELDRLRDDAGKKIWEACVWLDRDRLARRYSYQELVLEELQEKGIEVIFLHQAKAETPEDKILQGFQGLFAEYERVKITERMRRGKLHKARSGIYMNLQAPYGYTYIPKTKDKPPMLIINDIEAEVVRKIFYWVGNEGLTIRKVIKRLNELKIYPRKHKRDVWGNGPLCRLLRYEVYIGKAHYNKSIASIPENPKSHERYKKIKKSSRKVRPRDEWVPLDVPGIVDKDLFYKVQKQFSVNQKFNPRNRKAPYLLTSLIHCICGKRRIGEGVREHRYYRCTDRIYRYPFPKVCNASGVNAFHLDGLVWDKVANLLSNPELIKEQAERFNEKSKDRVLTSVEYKERLNKELKRLQDEEKRYLKVYGAGLIKFDQLKDELESNRGRREAIEKELIEAEKSNSGNIDITQINNPTEQVAKVIQSLTLDEKRTILQQVLEQVVVGDANKVLVKGFIPIGKDAQKVNLSYESRNCGFAKCRKKHPV